MADLAATSGDDDFVKVAPVVTDNGVSFPEPQTSPSLQYHAPEDLQLLIQTYRDVNQHLDSKVEEMTEQLETLKNERDAWKQRCALLTDTLQKLEREQTPTLPEMDLEQMQQLCNHITRDVSSDAFERDGIMVETLVRRGLTASWFIDPNEVVFIKALGEGAFGTTYLGKLHGAEVCVKCVKVETEQDQVSFFREIEALSCLRHPNIVPFIGACVELPDRCWLVCEYMEGGTLARWLHGDLAKPRTMLERLEKSLEVARGMQVCADCSPVIVHRDVKPSNIFLDAGGHARIGDFGLARRMNPEGTATLTGETGTYVYMSPEMIRHEVYTSATDVWSWAVVTCELMSKSLPYHGRYLTPIQVAVAVSEGNLKPNYPRDVHPRLNALLESVLVVDSLARPTFKMIVEEMHEIVTELKSTAQPEGFVRRLFGI